MCELLEPFAALTKYMEGQSYVSISVIQPLIKGILGAMSASDDDDDFASVQVRCSSTAPDEIPEPYIQ